MAAMENMDKSELFGRTIHVNVARPSQGGGSGGGGGSSGSGVRSMSFSALLYPLPLSLCQGLGLFQNCLCPWLSPVRVFCEGFSACMCTGPHA
mgnify:CR=1 FL=1